MTPARTDLHPALWASSISFLAGLWFFISQFIFGGFGTAAAWNGWIVGALIVIFAMTRRSHPAATRLSWFNFILGIWIIASPWMFGYTANAGRLINSLCVGFVVFCAAMMAAKSEPMSHDPNAGV